MDRNHQSAKSMRVGAIVTPPHTHPHTPPASRYTAERECLDTGLVIE